MPAVDDIDRLYRLMNEDGPFEQKARRALEIAKAHLGVDNVHLAKIDPESDYWRSVYTADPQDTAFPGGRVLDLGTTYCRHVLSDRGSVAIHDAPAEGWADDPAFDEHGLNCYYGTPIELDGETWGTLCFVSETPRSEPFTEAETTFAELVARLLEHELRCERAEAEIDRLDEFASVLSHDIRNPLAVALSRMELAQERHGTENLDQAVDALDRIEDIVSEVLEMARTGHHVDATEMETVRLSELADSCWATASGDRDHLVVEDDLRFRAAPDRLRHVLENLFRNAIEHGGEDVTVRVGPLPDRDGFYVEDDGRGIPPDERDVAREADYTTGEGNLGLGLAIVDRVVEAHDWGLTVAESATGGARFEFTGVVVER